MELDLSRLKAVTHYVCYRCADPSKLGAVKLNRVLLYSDWNYYLYAGKPITGDSYIKRQYGPVPGHILKAVEELCAESKIVTRTVSLFGKEKKEYIALTIPDISIFNAEEISIVDNMINRVCISHTADSISKASHDDIWRLAEIGEEIPSHAIFARELGEIDENDIVWTKSQLQSMN